MIRNKKAAVLALALVLFFCLSMPEVHAELSVSEIQEAFTSSAFNSEYGDNVGKIRRWAKPIKIFIEGAATKEDLTTIENFAELLNLRVNGLPQVSFTKKKANANLRITFAPLDELSALEPSYVPGNWGFCLYWYDENYCLTEARVLIASDVTTQEARNHLLLEEIVGSLGLTNDIDTHPDSIIYQPWTTTQHLSELDWELLDLLYDARLKPGMTLKKVKNALGWD